MKKLVITLTILGCSVFTWATHQENDIIFYKGQEGQLDVMLQNSLLLEYFQIHPEKKYPFEMISTANYRGHTATWEIKDGEVALLDISRRKWRIENEKSIKDIEKIPLSTIFEGKIQDGKVKADWFTGFMVVHFEKTKFFIKFPMTAILEVKGGKVTAEYIYPKDDFYNMLWGKKAVPAKDREMFTRCFPPREEKETAPAVIYSEKDFSLFLKRYIKGKKNESVLIPLTEFCLIKNAAAKENPPGWVIIYDIVPADNSNLLVLEMGASNVPEGPWSKYSPSGIQLVIKTDVPTQKAIDLSTAKVPILYAINNYAEYESPQAVLGTVQVMDKDDSNVILMADITLKSRNPATLQEIKINNAVIPVYTLEQYAVVYHNRQDIAAVLEKHKICQKYNTMQSDNK